MVEAIVKASRGEKMKTKTETKISLKNSIRKEILSWENVSEKKSNYSFVKAFFANGKEFCHFHSENEMDINYFGNVPKEILRNRNVSENPYSGKWFIYSFNSEKDAAELIKLAKQSYGKVKL